MSGPNRPHASFLLTNGARSVLDKAAKVDGTDYLRTIFTDGSQEVAEVAVVSRQ